MPVTTTYQAVEANRYLFDFKVCTVEKGYAQLDTPEDASYFGYWINPAERKLVNYAEGDLVIKTADTDDELVDLIRAIDNRYQQHHSGRARIDPGLDPAFRQAFVDIGAGEFLHPDLMPEAAA